VNTFSLLNGLGNAHVKETLHFITENVTFDCSLTVGNTLQ